MLTVIPAMHRIMRIANQATDTYTGHLLRSDIPDSLESLEHSLAELISRLK